VEYTFRNTPKEEEIKLKLGVNAIEITSGSTFRAIPYEGITEIVLNRNGSLYLMSIRASNVAPLQLSNISYNMNGEQIDLSRGYMTLVRVLHVHLYGKSKILFQTGSEKTKLFLCIAGFTGIAALAFVSAYYLNQLRMVPLYIVGLLIIPGFILLYKIRPSQWPKSYDPASLPTHLLPPAA